MNVKPLIGAQNQIALYEQMWQINQFLLSSRINAQRPELHRNVLVLLQSVFSERAACAKSKRFCNGFFNLILHINS